MLVLAALAVTLFIGFYYHILALQGMQQLTGGTPMLDHHVSGFTITDVEHLAERKDDDALGQYNCVHHRWSDLPGYARLSVIGRAMDMHQTYKWGAVVAAVIYAGLEIWA